MCIIHFFDSTTLQILGQKFFQIFFFGLLENLRYFNFILKLSDLYSYCHFLIFLSELILNPHITLIFGLSPVVSDLVQFTLKDLSLDIQTRIPVRTNLNTIFCVNMIRKPWDCGFSGLNRMSAIKSNVKKPLENVVVWVAVRFLERTTMELDFSSHPGWVFVKNKFFLFSRIFSHERNWHEKAQQCCKIQIIEWWN